jgi:hypothetical protein
MYKYLAINLCFFLNLLSPPCSLYHNTLEQAALSLRTTEN